MNSLDPKEIFLEVISSKFVHEKWAGKPHESFKNLGNSSKGDSGVDFVLKYGELLGFKTEKKSNKLGDWDIKINDKKFEVKLATEDVSGSFQFNHIRYDSKYDFLICIGVSPSELYFNAWSKADVATGNAGNLVSMGKNQNSSFKLTKKSSLLKNISDFKSHIEQLLSKK